MRSCPCCGLARCRCYVGALCLQCRPPKCKIHCARHEITDNPELIAEARDDAIERAGLWLVEGRWV